MHIHNTKTRILLFDIETMANLAYVWGKYEQDVVDYEREWYMLSFAHKWLDEKSTHVTALPDFKGYAKDKTNDKLLVKALWDLFDEADIIIAHNGASFDVKKANAKFIEHGLPPPSPYKVIDTKLVAKRYFNFNSNKLDDLAKILGLGRKIDTGGFELWLGCASGDKKSWKKMCDYNKHDVNLLEAVYLKMRAWMVNHPKLCLLDGDRGLCPTCNSSQLQKRGFGVRGNSARVQRLQCQSCGAWTNENLAKPKVRKVKALPQVAKKKKEE